MRLRRTIFTPAAALSAVLCVAVCALWASSHLGEADTLELWQRGSAESRWVSSDSGLLTFFEHRPDGRGGNASYNYASPELIGFRYRKVYSANARTMTVEAPHRLLAVLTALLPVLWLSGRIRRRRDPRSVPCPACGYDLRATPDRCPECGQPRPRAATCRN